MMIHGRRLWWHLPVTVALLAYLLLAGVDSTATTPGAEQVEGMAEQAVRIRQATQQTRDNWAAELQKAREEIESLKRQLQDLGSQRRRTEAYLGEEQKMLEEHRRRLEMFREIRASLDPVLDESYERLALFVENDLPFLEDERRAQLAAARQALYDYHAGPADKARPLLDAMAKEVGYGSSMEVIEEEIEVDGLARRVRLLRIGRAGLFALSLDLRTAWRWNRQDRKWERLNGSVHDIHKAMEIADKQRVADLVKLPFGVLSTVEGQP